MKRCLFVVLLVIVGVVETRGAVFLPSAMAPIRSAIIEELAVLTNNPSASTEELRQARLLRQARRTLDRVGRPSLFGDVQILASLASSLRHAFPDGEFDLLLQVAVADYQEALANAALSLSNRVVALPASGSAINASNTLASVFTALDELDPNAGITSGIQALNRAAVRLRSVEGLLSRTRSTINRSDRMMARADNATFVANTGPSLSAIYNPALQFLTISGRQVSGTPSVSRTIKLYLANVAPGTTTHSFGSPATGTYATYSVTSSTNSGGFTSGSGTAIVTLDSSANTVSGHFSFNGVDELNGTAPVRLTAGEFFIHLQ